MTAIPKPYRHLQIFSVCLGLLVVVLGVFLFAVKIEQTAIGNGVVYGGGAREIFAPVTGRIRISTGEDLMYFPDLRPGTIGSDSQRLLEIEPSARKSPIVVYPIDSGARQDLPFMIAESDIHPGDLVQAGQKLATIIPLRSGEGDLLLPMVRAEFNEKQFGGVKVGQSVRVRSNMFLSRTHGHAEGIISSVRPTSVAGQSGGRKFVAEVTVNRSPFPLLHGSSVEVEVILGRKETFRVILEH